jgi:hypothetical protein
MKVPRHLGERREQYRAIGAKKKFFMKIKKVLDTTSRFSYWMARVAEKRRTQVMKKIEKYSPRTTIYEPDKVRLRKIMKQLNLTEAEIVRRAMRIGFSTLEKIHLPGGEGDDKNLSI